MRIFIRNMRYSTNPRYSGTGKIIRKRRGVFRVITEMEQTVV